MDNRTDRQVDRWTIKAERQMDSSTDMQADRWTDRDIQLDRQMDRWRAKQTE